MDRTKYRTMVVSPTSTRILKPGSDNSKLGRVVTKGHLMGAEVYQVSLEERATCSTACAVWDKCYGNNMPFAHRIDHTHPDFTQKLVAEVAAACEKHRLVLVRLHVLGDFFSPGYAALWSQLLFMHPNLHCFGYTAWDKDSAIGVTVDHVAEVHGWNRFAIRHSGARDQHRAALVGDAYPEIEAFWCPEQEGKAKSCADCGACWNGETTVRFKPH